MFAGSIVALVTPMHQDGSVDKTRLGELLEWHISQKTDAIVINGTTGEAATLEPAEQHELLDFTLDCINERIPVIMGTGSNSTKRTIVHTQAAFESGAAGCLVVTPYYNKPTQEGLYQHYKVVAQASIGPILLYNVPSRTGCDMQPATVQRLMEFPNIVGIKEAVGTDERYAELVRLCGKPFNILSGDDETALNLLRMGGKGVISVTANVAPGAVSTMCKAAQAGEWALAESIQHKLDPLNKKLFVESNPIPVKWAMQEMGLIESGMRLPLTPLADKYHADVKAALIEAGVLRT